MVSDNYVRRYRQRTGLARQKWLAAMRVLLELAAVQIRSRNLFGAVVQQRTFKLHWRKITLGGSFLIQQRVLVQTVLREAIAKGSRYMLNTHLGCESYSSVVQHVTMVTRDTIPSSLSLKGEYIINRIFEFHFDVDERHSYDVVHCRS